MSPRGRAIDPPGPSLSGGSCLDKTIILKVRTMLAGCTYLKCVFGQKMCKCVGKTAGKPDNVDNALLWLVFVLLQPVHIVGL